MLTSDPFIKNSYALQTNNKNFRISKLHYKNSGGEKGITLFEYDEYGIMHKALWKLADGSRTSQNYYTFDNRGNLLRKYRDFSDGIISDILYEYDDPGNLIFEYFERSDGIGGIVQYEYDDYGKMTVADCKGLNGWFYGIITYEYNDDKKVKGLIEQDGRPVGTILYSYDKNGNLSKEYWDFPGQWNQTLIYEYEPNKTISFKSFSSGNVFITNTNEYQIKKEEYDYNNQTGGPSFYEYDKNGKLLKKTFTRKDGLWTETTYTYNNDGTLKRSYREYSNRLNAVFNYTYNGNRKLVQRTFRRSDGTTGSEVYEYNGKWQLTKAIYDNFDSWLSGMISFKYNTDGLISKGFFTGDKYNAEISFEHDDRGNIVKIFWQFSSGITQTYSFEYEKRKN